MWADAWTLKFIQAAKSSGLDGIRRFGNLLVKRLQSRAANQIINALIQGSCATLAKRSILRIRDRLTKEGLWAHQMVDPRARFMIPIHDELVWSIHYKDVPQFILLAKEIMKDHPDIIKDLKIDCTAAIGTTFEPFHADKVKYGQIEIDEAPKLDFVPAGEVGKKMSAPTIQATIDYLRASL